MEQILKEYLDNLRCDIRNIHAKTDELIKKQIELEKDFDQLSKSLAQHIIDEEKITRKAGLICSAIISVAGGLIAVGIGYIFKFFGIH